MTDDHRHGKEDDIIISGRQIIIISFIMSMMMTMMMMMMMMTSNHVHCFHDLLHGKARPRPPSHVHLREGSLAFTSILEIFQALQHLDIHVVFVIALVISIFTSKHSLSSSSVAPRHSAESSRPPRTFD